MFFVFPFRTDVVSGGIPGGVLQVHVFGGGNGEVRHTGGARDGQESGAS